MPSDSRSPIGPIMQRIITKVWNKLFDDTPGNEWYLPGIIRYGSDQSGLPSYDPAYVADGGAPLAIDNVDQATVDSACDCQGVKWVAIASTKPTLSLSNLQLTGLSNMRPITLDFASDAPTFSAQVVVAPGGSDDKVLLVTAADQNKPNYHFSVGCCEPVSNDVRDCSKNTWSAEASDNFTCRMRKLTLTTTIQLNLPPSGPATVNVLKISVGLDPTNIDLDFAVRKLPAWAQRFPKIAVNVGVSQSALGLAIQQFLNSDLVRGNLEKIISRQLARLPSEESMVAALQQ